MVTLELRELHELLQQKVNLIQREFTSIADYLATLRKKWTEEEETERPKILKEQEALKEKQLLLAEQVNIWRDRIRVIENPSSEKAVKDALDELAASNDADIVEAIKNARRLMEMDPEEKAALLNKAAAASSNTPVGRLLERARTSYDLRSGGLISRQEAAVEFSNRPAMAQDESVVDELESALNNTDPVVADVALRTYIQILRFRSMRLAELDSGLRAVQKMAKIKNPLVIPILIEILKTPRQGYLYVDGVLQEGPNDSMRLLALIALVDWRTQDSQQAIHTRLHDKDHRIAEAAQRALEAFPGEWAEQPGSEK